MRYAQKVKMVKTAGMAVDPDSGNAFTVCGGQLVTGEDAPPHITRMNGWPVEHVAAALSKRQPR